MSPRGRKPPPSPVKVVLAGARSVEPIIATRQAAPRYRSAWIYVLEGGRMVAKLDLDLEEDVIPAATVASLVSDAVTAAAPAYAPVGAETPVADADLPSASVVVPTLFRRSEELSSCLDSLTALDYPDFEIILVDNRREEGAEAELAGHPRARVVRESLPGISAAKNAGVRAARGSIVAFTDDDIRVDRSWLRSLVTPLVRDATIAAVTGLVLPAELETAAQYWFEEYCGGFGRGLSPVVYRLSPKETHPHSPSIISTFDSSGRGTGTLSLYSAAARLATGGSMALRRDVLSSGKGFDTSLGAGTRSGGGEDLLLCARILMSGAAMRYEPAALSFHRHRQTYGELVRQVRAWGTGLTGMLVALVCEDRSQLSQIARLAPAGFTRALFRYRRGAPQETPARPSFPRRLQLHELSGMVAGVPLYLLSRLEERARTGGRRHP